MRACIQRVERAKVTVNNQVVGEIQRGLLVLLGVGHDDGDAEVDLLVRKTCGLRIFEDEQGKMNLSLEQVGGEMLVVSQFTLYADCRHGKRPSFTAAAPPEQAKMLYEKFVDQIRARGIIVATGCFREEMAIELVNIGPVTIWLDTAELIK